MLALAERTRTRNRSASARPSAAGSAPPPGPLASTRESATTDCTRCCSSDFERTRTSAAPAGPGHLPQPVLANRGEVEVAGAAEDPQVPGVLAPLGVDICVGEANAVGGEAGEAAVVMVAVSVEAAQVVVQYGGDACRAQPVDVAAHVACPGANLRLHPAANGIQQLKAHQLG